MVSGKLHSEWIESGRLHACMGVSATDKRFEAMLAVQERTQQQIAQISKEVTLFTEQNTLLSKQNALLSKEVTRVNITSNNLANNQRKCYEQLVCGVLARYLEQKGFTDVTVEETEKYRKTGYFTEADGAVVDSVQWDGLIFCMQGNTELVFFLEAKKTRETKGMLNMPERVNRTLQFIEACHSKQVPETGASQGFKTICLMWNRCYGREARGVLAADFIPSSAVAMATQQGYISITSGDEAFEVLDPREGTSAKFSLEVTP
jgi:hypothetical protein